MFELLQNFVSRIDSIDTKYDQEIKDIEAAEKEALDRIQAEKAQIEADHARKMAAIKAEHKKRMSEIKAARPSREVEEALRRHRELASKFEALMAK